MQKADRDKILDDASLLYNDVKVPERDREFVTEKEFLDDDVWTLQGTEGIWNSIHCLKPETASTEAAPESTTLGGLGAKPAPETSDKESLASSIDSSGEDAEAEHLADIHQIETSKLVTGKAKKSWVHVIDPADDGLAHS